MVTPAFAISSLSPYHTSMSSALPSQRRLTLAAVTVAVLACPAAEPPGPELLPLPAPPDLASLDPAVRQQLAKSHDFVARLLADGSAEAEGLAWGFGQLARVYHGYQDLARARTCYTNARRLEPGEFRWAYFLGHVERSEGRFGVSSGHFEDALALRPEHVPTLVWLGENAFDQHLLGRARDRFGAALAIDPGCIKARAGLARTALERGEPAIALGHLELALAAQPEATPLHYALGLAYRDLGDDVRARSFFDRIPSDSDARLPIAFDDPLMQQVSDLRDSTQHHARSGMKAIAQGRFRAAVGELEKAVAADPDRADTRYNLAAALLRLGRREAARAELDALSERSPEYVQARVLLARMLIAEGSLEAAERHLRRALESDPAAERVHLVLGDVLRQGGRLQEALASYLRARELAPELTSARFGAAAVLMRQGSFRQAAEVLEESLAALPGSRDLELLLARLLAAAPQRELRDGERALELATAAVRGGETVADAETLAMALAEAGRFPEALRWQRAALARVESTGGDVRRLRRRLALYRDGSPCREPWAATERLTAHRVQAPAGSRPETQRARRPDGLLRAR